MAILLLFNTKIYKMTFIFKIKSLGILCTVFLLANCKVEQKIDIQGHRGARGHYPENTIKGFLKAIDLGVNTLEMDVVISKDKKVLLSHEPFMNHEICLKPDGSEIIEAEEKNYNIYKMNYSDIMKYDCGIKIHPRFLEQEKVKSFKPLLSEVIQAVENYLPAGKKIFYNIEIKTRKETDSIFHPAPKEFVDLLMKEILSAGIIDRVIIQSFDVRTIQIVHKEYAKTKIALLVENNLSILQNINLLGFKPDIYSPHFKLVNQDLLKYCEKNKIKLIPWTVNDVQDIEKMVIWEVGGIISDYPDRVITVLKDLEK